MTSFRTSSSCRDSSVSRASAADDEEVPSPSDSVRANSANRLATFVSVPRGFAAPLPPVKMRSRSVSMSSDGGGREAGEVDLEAMMFVNKCSN